MAWMSCLCCVYACVCVCVWQRETVHVCVHLFLSREKKKKNEREHVHIWLFQVFSAWIEARSHGRELRSTKKYDEDVFLKQSWDHILKQDGESDFFSLMVLHSGCTFSLHLWRWAVQNSLKLRSLVGRLVWRDHLYVFAYSILNFFWATPPPPPRKPPTLNSLWKCFIITGDSSKKKKDWKGLEQFCQILRLPLRVH